MTELKGEAGTGENGRFFEVGFAFRPSLPRFQEWNSPSAIRSLVIAFYLANETQATLPHFV
jgi:hypothetical protein